MGLNQQRFLTKVDLPQNSTELFGDDQTDTKLTPNQAKIPEKSKFRPSVRKPFKTKTTEIFHEILGHPT